MAQPLLLMKAALKKLRFAILDFLACICEGVPPIRDTGESRHLENPAFATGDKYPGSTAFSLPFQR
jgi:hypothetical protein